MKTLIQGGYAVGFNGKEHEVIKDGVVVFEVKLFYKKSCAIM